VHRPIAGHTTPFDPGILVSSPEQTGTENEKATDTGEFEMNNTITRTIARFALPVVSAGLIGGAALGMAGIANAANPTDPIGPGYKYVPSVTAPPAASAPTYHHGVARVEQLVPGYHR
jgi:hypothetical protein